MEVVVASLNEKKMVKGQARARILSMNLTRRLPKSQWRGLHDTFLDICIFFSVAVVVAFNNTAPLDQRRLGQKRTMRRLIHSCSFSDCSF